MLKDFHGQNFRFRIQVFCHTLHVIHRRRNIISCGCWIAWLLQYCCCQFVSGQTLLSVVGEKIISPVLCYSPHWANAVDYHFDVFVMRSNLESRGPVVKQSRAPTPTRSQRSLASRAIRPLPRRTRRGSRKSREIAPPLSKRQFKSERQWRM